MHLMKKVVFAAIASAMVAAAQTNDGPFQVRYASNLSAGDSVINITNDGANGAPALGPGFGSSVGNICVNVYAFSSDEQLVSCCSCLVTPNGLVSLSAVNDLISNTATGVKPNSLVVKLTAVQAGTTGVPGNCSQAAATAPASGLVPGMLAWGTTIHAAPGGGFGVTETAFSNGTLSAGEYTSITGRCASIIGNLSGFGICRSCRIGGLGGSRQ